MNQPISAELKEKGERARSAAYRLATVSASVKNGALHAVADALLQRMDEILAANRQDVAAGRDSGLSDALLDRLRLDAERIRAVSSDVRAVAALTDPVGESFDVRVLPNGLRIERRRVPVGVIGVIYESRPNVTVDVAALCLKSGNAALLRGGKEAVRSNRILAAVVSEASTAAGIPEGAVQLIESADRSLVREILQAGCYIDMIIPRGGAELHRFAQENSTVPVITGGIGICHAYVEKTADLNQVVPIVRNAKVQRPTVCNALDVLLIDREVAAEWLPRIAEDLHRFGVRLKCDPKAYEILQGREFVETASGADFDTEFLALVLAVKVVDNLEEAMEHVRRHSSGHSDAILTRDYSCALRFVNEIDSAAVYVNASTRFTDGAQFGLGAEVAVSTQRLHARGPMGLQELTTYKWVIFGEGQIRE